MTTLLHGIVQALPGERVLAVHPEVTPLVQGTWRRRTNLFTGRALGPSALATDQDNRAGRLALCGQSLSPGVVAGLEASVERIGGVWTLQVATGVGIAASGEDVRLVRPISVPLDELEISVTRASTATLSLGQWRAPAGDRPFDPFPLAAIILLQPISVNRIGDQDPESACELDAADIAFEDEQIVDGVRVVLVEFPRTFTQTPLSPRWRNELVYEIFRQEALLGASGMLPWEPLGVGIGLLGISGQAEAPFVDIHGVARDGGELNRRRPSFGAPGTRQLWQARVRQFVDELGPADPAELASTRQLSDQFRYLPPVGVLPTGAIDVRGDRGEPHLALPKSPLFPETYVVEAVPVELESLDDLLRGSINLEPFDTLEEEQVQILVPVPQRHFSPDLLRVEDQTPDEFREAIRLFLLRLNHRLGRRADVRRAEQRLSDVLFAMPPVHEVRDAEAVPGELPSLFPGDAQLPDTDPRPPLEAPFADNLEPGILQLGERMAIVVGATALAQLVEELRAETRQETPNEVPEISNATAARRFLDTSAGERGLVGFVEEVSKRLIRASEALDVAFSRTSTALFQIRAISSDETAATRLAISPALPFLARNRGVQLSGQQARTFETFLRTAEQRPIPRFPAPPPERPAIVLQSLRLPGAELVSPALLFGQNVKERLESPPALDIANNAVRAKRAAYRSLRSIHQSGLALFGLPFHGFRVPADRSAEQLLNPTDEDLLSEPPPGDTLVRERTVGIKWVILFLRFFEEAGYWPHDDFEDINEADLMAAALDSIEQTIAALRLAEARLAGFDRALVLAREHLDTLNLTWNAVQRRLSSLEEEIAELRRDVRVATALETEEIARATRVNQERTSVLRTLVPYLVFRRPRSIDGLSPAPAHVTRPALALDPVPACLRGDFEIPDPLRVMVDLVREAPVRWLPFAAAQLPRINRQLALHQIALLALQRAANPVALAYNPFATAIFDRDTGLRIREIFEEQRRALGELRVRRLRFELPHFVLLSWRGLVVELGPVATVNDLILASHGRHEVSDALAHRLNDLNRVVACLHERLRQVLPLLRLVWSELLEVTRGPVDLRELSALPNFEAVDASDQRYLQRLVDWLYQQVAPDQDDALRFMHDLIRVTIMLSSHGPTQQIVSAPTVNAHPVVAGAVIEVALDVTRARVGMHVLLFETSSPTPPAARGVIEDLAAGVITVRVSATDADRSVLPVRAELVEPDRNPQVELATGQPASFGIAGLG